MGIVDFLFKSEKQRQVKKLGVIADKIEALEPKYAAMSDDELRRQTELFRCRLKDGEKLDNLLNEAFAVCREAAKRVLNMRHFRVQLIGGIVLHQGRIAEMQTGEGKTLVATLPAYLNALAGKGVHIVTVNDYLAKRDAEWMGKVYKFLGLTVGVIAPGMNRAERKAAYAADITYATNNEVGFDYLRDNMARSLDDVVQRGHAFAIVDEVDSILIDEARTPLIISGPAAESNELYVKTDKFVKTLKEDDYVKKEKEHSTSPYVLCMANGESLSKASFASLWAIVTARTATENRPLGSSIQGSNSGPLKTSLDFSCHPHQLRHTYITQLFETGMDIKQVQYLAGHSSPDMTMKVYTHYRRKSREQETADKVDLACKYLVG